MSVKHSLSLVSQLNNITVIIKNNLIRRRVTLVRVHRNEPMNWLVSFRVLHSRFLRSYAAVFRKAAQNAAVQPR